MSDNERLGNKIRTWLDKQGYPLEMRTAAAFRAEGLTVMQSQYYLDPETQKPREIDVICDMANSELPVACLRLVIECKSGNKPWIVFSSAHTLYGFNRLFALGVLSDTVRRELAATTPDGPERLMWFKKDGRVGYGVAQAFTDESPTPFVAVLSAVKASLWQHTNLGPASVPLFAVFPVVVLDSPLFECYLDDQGSLQLAEVATIDFFFQMQIGSFSGTCVRFVTARGLPDYCREVKAEFGALLGILEPTFERYWDVLMRRADRQASGIAEPQE
ncbi:MAG: hypothetical protein P9M00_06620 [Candidatus Tritonobacter lacicola]|nr:hypothetical protein [Candidatus Tritonobacter lacicola]